MITFRVEATRQSRPHLEHALVDHRAGAQHAPQDLLHLVDVGADLVALEHLLGDPVPVVRLALLARQFDFGVHAVTSL
jgi:hypothetical protein